MSKAESQHTVVITTPRPGVGLITLDRAESLNALSRRVERDIVEAARHFDADAEIGAVVITGSPRSFAAGADIAEMSRVTFADVELDGLFHGWDSLAALRTPLVAAVSGYALGGGAELAMLCDLVIAAESAVFGQPEVKLGILPGFGGTQRLTRAVGKAMAMDMCLTGRSLNAQEALHAGLVSRVVPNDELLDAALAVGRLPGPR